MGSQAGEGYITWQRCPKFATFQPLAVDFSGGLLFPDQTYNQEQYGAGSSSFDLVMKYVIANLINIAGYNIPYSINKHRSALILRHHWNYF